jgi:hypothetical protein
MFFSNGGRYKSIDNQVNLLSSYAYSVLSGLKVFKKKLWPGSHHPLQQRKRRVYSKPKRFDAQMTLGVVKSFYFKK